MKSELGSNRTILKFGVFVVASSAVLVVGTTHTKPAHLPTLQESLPIRVTTLARSIEAVGEKRDGNELYLTLHNGYDKSISAFVVSLGGQHFIITELIGTDGLLAAGGRHVQKYILPTNQRIINETLVTVMAVVFDDRTGDGNSSIIKGILEKRSAERAQIDRILPLWNWLLSASEVDIKGLLATAGVRIAQLPVQNEETDSSDVRSGLYNTKQLALHHFKQLEELYRERGEALFRQALIRIKEQYEQKRARL